MSDLGSRARLLIMPESIELLDLDFKRKEAEFKRLVTAAHKLFCNCSDPTSHLKWRTSTGGDTTDQDGPTTGGGTIDQEGPTTGGDEQNGR
nr:MAG: ORF2 [Anelloviridae sp.]